MTEDQRKAAEWAILEEWLQAEIDIAASISLLPAEAEKKAVAHVEP